MQKKLVEFLFGIALILFILMLYGPFIRTYGEGGVPQSNYYNMENSTFDNKFVNSS